MPPGRAAFCIARWHCRKRHSLRFQRHKVCSLILKMLLRCLKEFSSGEQTLPYPPEQAAMHHVFPGGWVWVLKFNNGITSAGVAATDAIANELRFDEGEPAWRRLLARLPSLAEMFGPARAVIPFVHSPCLAFQSATITGSHWALLPYAAGFVDPLLSTGFPLTLLGVTRIARLLQSNRRQAGFQNALAEYSNMTALELETASRLIGALYATMNRFDLFRDLSLLYFVAASYSETVRRLGKPHLANSFLLCRHPVFGPQLRQFCEALNNPLSANEAGQLSENIRAAIKPFDVAGLTDRSRHHWYPAQTSDLFTNAAKVEANADEIQAMLKRCGLS